MNLHLDSEYRNRYELYILEDGSVKDSRLINWRDVEWDKVNEIQFYINGLLHCIDKNNKKNFKYFMRFRWGGREAEYDKDKHFLRFKNINIWTFGWTDGEIVYLKDFDFKTGNFIKEYEMKLKELESHIHPRIK